MIAGNAMSRRAIYMFGALLPRNPRGGVNGGLGQTTSAGTVTLILPTETITKTGEKRTIDGVEMVFQMTPGTEAPAEMNTWFPQFKAMWMAENATNTLHNVLTLRGAQVRDPLKWAGYLDETIDLYGGGRRGQVPEPPLADVGQREDRRLLKKQRDLYKYIHDQSVRLMNQGYIGSEIAETIELPPELDQYWPNRGYYGTLRHNSRAVYQRYMGWYDANPVRPERPAARARREEVRRVHGWRGGGAREGARRLRQGRISLGRDGGEARRVREPGQRRGQATARRRLRATRLSGRVRPVALGVPAGRARAAQRRADIGGIATASPDIIRAMPPEMLFDYMAVRLNGPKAAGRKFDAQHRLHRPRRSSTP